MDLVLGRKRRAAKVVTALALSAAALFSFGGVSHAATGDQTASTTVTLTVNGGPMTLATNTGHAQFPNGLNGKAGGSDLTNATAPAGTLSFTDARGTGAGYKVTASATQLTNGKQTLPASSLTLDKAPSVAADDPTSGATPAVSATAGQALDGASPVLLTSAADPTTGKGMGSYKANLSNFKLAKLAANTYAGTYTSTVTYDLTTAP